MGVKLPTQLCCSKLLTKLNEKLKKAAMEESSSTKTSKQTIQQGQLTGACIKDPTIGTE